MNVGPVQLTQVQRTLHGRKHSVGAPANSKKLGFFEISDEGNDYTPAFRKKMSVPQTTLRQRANSTL